MVVVVFGGAFALSDPLAPLASAPFAVATVVVVVGAPRVHGTGFHGSGSVLV